MVGQQDYTNPVTLWILFNKTYFFFSEVIEKYQPFYNMNSRYITGFHIFKPWYFDTLYTVFLINEEFYRIGGLHCRIHEVSEINAGFTS